MRSILLALCAATTISTAFCQDHAGPAIRPRNDSAPNSPLPPPGCSTCEEGQENCTFADDVKIMCTPPDSSETTASISPGTEPEIARNTLLSESTSADLTDITTELASDAITAALTTTEESIARTAEATTTIAETSAPHSTDTTRDMCNPFSEIQCGHACCDADEICDSVGTCIGVSRGDTATTTHGSSAAPRTPVQTYQVSSSMFGEGFDLSWWCADQTSNCPMRCPPNGKAKSNECDIQKVAGHEEMSNVTVSCICEDGTTPDPALYAHTIEDNICWRLRDDCLNNLLHANSFSHEDQDNCFESKCAKLDVRINTNGSTTTSSVLHPNSKPTTRITAQTTGILIPALGLDLPHIRASVVDLVDRVTTFKLECDYSNPEAKCGSALPAATLTLGPETWKIYSALGNQLIATSECSWPTTRTEAVCEVDNTETTTVTMEKLDTITVTAGAYKLVQPVGLGSGDGTGVDIGVGGDSNNGDAGIAVSQVSKKSAGISVEVGVSSALVALMLMLVLAL